MANTDLARLLKAEEIRKVLRAPRYFKINLFLLSIFTMMTCLHRALGYDSQ